MEVITMSELEKVELNDAEVKEAVGGLAIGTCDKDPTNHLASESFCKGCPNVSRSKSYPSLDEYDCKCGNGIHGSWSELIL